MSSHQKFSIKDVIYDTIFFDKIVWEFIDTPHFQRLRKIKQLACLEYVFPSATHTRYQHSIGTAYLANKFLKRLIKNNKTHYPKKQIEEVALKTITIAGLLHDVGHGPFSHAFGQIVTKIKKDGEVKLPDWSHEHASELLIDHMVKYINQKNKLAIKQGTKKEILSPDEIMRVKALIKGEPGFSDPYLKERKWQYQIIRNKINGIDVNQLDYFRRDAFYLRVKNIYINHDLLFNQARIMGDEICYPSNSVETVYNIFHSRYKLYKNYYFDVVNKSIEIMVCDILKKTSDYFKFVEACQELPTNPDKYIKLTDGIVDVVQEKYDRMIKNGNADPIMLKNFEEAVSILKRIKTRKNYRFVKEISYYIREKEDAQVLDLFRKELTAEKIVMKVSEQAGVHPNDLFVTISNVGYGVNDANPMKKVAFFRSEQGVTQKSIKMEENEIQTLSMLYTSAYIQRSIKLFIKMENFIIFERVDEAFSKFRTNFNKDCEHVLNKEMGFNYVFEGKGGVTPASVPKELPTVVQASELQFT